MSDLKVERQQHYTCGNIHVHTRIKNGVARISNVFIGSPYDIKGDAIKQITEIQKLLSIIQSEIARFENLNSDNERGEL